MRLSSGMGADMAERVTESEARARDILLGLGIGQAEAAIAARVILALEPTGWDQLFLSREELAHAVGLSISGVSYREVHRDTPDAARPRIVKVGASGRRETVLWLAPLTLQYYADHPPE